MTQVYAIALPVPLARLFDYRAEPAMAGRAAPGARVLVEFGRRRVVGIIAARGGQADAPAALKPVIELLDERPLFDAACLDVLRRVARYYHAGLGEVAATALPAGLRRADTPLTPQARLHILTTAGRALDSGQWRGPAQRALHARLLGGGLADTELVDAPARWRSLLREWRSQGWVDSIALAPWSPPPLRAAGPALSVAQQAAVTAVQGALGGFARFLIDGVTGSGKTEVYLHALEATLARGGQGLLLVPEIGLTPQLLARVRERLPGRVAALHSELSEGERAQVWRAAAGGEIDVLVGTRSAVFVPLPRLGLVVVDEEHDASYKQQDGIRYHARDVAILRAQAAAAPIVLGSATPSLDTLQRVASGQFLSLALPERAGGASRPRWQLVDLRGQRPPDGLATATVDRIRDHLQQGAQVLVFRNRRGYAPALVCNDCGWHAGCPDCDVALTLHRRSRSLRCHQCGHVEAVPPACPACGSLALEAQGVGTERLEEALARHFPGHELVRLDRDTTSRKQSFERAITRLLEGRPALVVGTQMLAKGHHLPAVTLVVVVGVDEGLMSADFRAGERLAQLLEQVAGRSGRAGRSGEVLIQTRQPEHPLLQTLLREGYGAWARGALAERALTELPPCRHAAVIAAEHLEGEAAEAFLEHLRAAIDDVPEVDVAGPLPALQARRQGRWRFRLILLSAQRAALHALLDRAIAAAATLPRDHKLRWHVDVDPLDFS
jgi:primosomal protein N' (replication factor Y)